MKNKVNFLFVLIILFGCRPKYTNIPSEIIEPEKFTDILTDVRLAEANQKLMQQNGVTGENLLDSSYHIVYKLHEVTQKQVVESYKFYVLHPEWMDKISNDVIDRLNHLED